MAKAVSFGRSRGTRRRSKYGNVKVKLDGHTFDSKAEARRYGELKMLEKAGKIDELEVHPVFVLSVPSTSGYVSRALKAMANGGTFRIGKMIADFKYRDASTVPYVVEDVKGRDNALSRWKRKHVEAQYGIKIRVVRYGR